MSGKKQLKENINPTARICSERFTPAKYASKSHTAHGTLSWTDVQASVEGAVFEGKTPVIPEAEAPIDHDAFIELLRRRRDNGEEHIPTNSDPRGVCLNAYETIAAA
jgi:hypothetical protein